MVTTYAGGFGIVSFIFLIAFLYIGFFGGEDQLKNIYPEHSEIIHFISEIIRIAFWILIIIVIIFVIIAVVGGLASRRW